MHIFKKGSLIRQLQIHFNNMTSKLQKECGGTAGAKELATIQLIEIVINISRYKGPD